MKKALLLLMLMSTTTWAAPQEPRELKCNYRMNPVGIDDHKPHLSWLVNDSAQDAMQAAYQVQAALTEKDLHNEKDLLWDSGKVESAQSLQVAYAGRPLESRQHVFWRVRTWDKVGTVSPWSESARFETAFLNKGDWRDAKWIGADQDFDGPEPAPKELMGDWIVAPEGFKSLPENHQGGFCGQHDSEQPRDFQTDSKVFQYAVDVDLPNKPIVSAMAYWDTRPEMRKEQQQHAAVLVGYEKGWTSTSIHAVEQQRLLDWSRRGFADLAFYLKPGKKNRIGLVFKGGMSKVTATVGMRIVFADGDEMVIKSGPDWRAVGMELDETAVVKVVEPYGGPKFGQAHVFSKKRLAPVWYRRTVSVKPGLKQARLYMCALGWGRSYINGQEVDDHLSMPPQTDYEAYSYYTTQDITSLLNEGDNALAVYLASGWYRQIGGFGIQIYGCPGMIALVALDYKNGKTEWISTGPDWQQKEGILTSANVYMGERVDYRRAHDDWKSPGKGKDWQPVRILEPLTPKLVACDVAPVRPTQSIKPVKKWQTGKQTWIYDLGEVVYGIIKFKFHEKPGETIRVRYVEMANDGAELENVPVSQWWCHALTQGDVITSDGKPHVYRSEFCTKSFRYFEISGVANPPEDVEAFVVHTDAEVFIDFKSSDNMLNRLFENGMRTFRNYVSHIPSDIPRERCLWGTESTYAWVTSFYGFDWALNHKMMADLWLTGAMGPEGVPSHIGVGKRGTTNSPHDFNWNITALPLAYRIYSHYGDLRTAEKHYPLLRHMLDHFEKTAKDGVLITLPAFGDHAHPGLRKGKQQQNKPLIQTFGFYEAQRMFAQLAEALGKKEDARHASDRARKIREAILSFYDPAAHTFGNGTHDSLALAMGIFEDDPQEKRLLAASLAKYYADNGHKFDGGFMSYNIYPELSRAGYVDDAIKMLLNDSYPGPVRSIKNHDATTYWEMYAKDPQIQRQRGLNFYAFAHPTGWMVTDLAGIRFDPKVPGGQRLILEPQVPIREKLDWVKGEMKTQYGLVRSSWKKENGTLHWQFTIPANTTAEVSFPVPNYKIKGRLLRNEEHRTVYEMGAGSYRFKMPM